MFLQENKSRRSPLVRKAAMLLVEADAQLPSGFPDDE
jgi:hypothetical protein